MADDDKILITLDPLSDRYQINSLVDQLTAIIALRGASIPITEWPINLIVLELRCLQAVEFVRAEAPAVTDEQEY